MAELEKLYISRIERNGMTPEMPRFQTPGSAAFDLAVFTEEPIVVLSGDRECIPTGLRMEIPEGMAGLVLIRSGISFEHGVSLTNGAGLIDSDYRGEILISVTNNSALPVVFHNGDRIAQLMLINLPRVDIVQSDALSDTLRGEGGFGSTGERDI